MSRAWIVQPHGPIEKLEDNLWTVRGKVPGVPGFTRRMSIVRRDDGSLVVRVTDDGVGGADPS